MTQFLLGFATATIAFLVLLFCAAVDAEERPTQREIDRFQADRQLHHLSVSALTAMLDEFRQLRQQPGRARRRSEREQ